MFASPLISDPVTTPDTIFTTSSSPAVNFQTSISVTTNNGSEISSVSVTIFDPLGNEMGTFPMNSSNSLSDISNGSGNYSANINLTGISCLIVGNYSLEYVAVNEAHLNSNTILSELKVVNTANQPPVIASTNLPDSVVRPSPGDSVLLTISMNATDPDGLCDLKSASFVTVRPNGVTLPPIPMLYDNNGRFSFSAYVYYSSDPTSYGYFKYTFTAKDRSDVLSSPVTDSIKFLQP